MGIRRHFHLRDVVDISVLQEIQDLFSDATGLASIIVDYQGKPVVRYSNFRPFCNRVRQFAMGREGCEQSDAHAGLEAVRQSRPYIYRCHMGLVDLAAPIVVDGQYLGSIMAGQVLVEDEIMETLDRIAKAGLSLSQHPDLKQAMEDIPVMPFARVQASAHLMYAIANYIAEKGVAGLVQQQLNEQNIRLMEEIKARADLEKALKDAELKALQSQINPHFLFNTLNIISRLALVEGAPKTQEVVFALAELLRGSLGKVGQVATLGDEIDYIRHYLLIQQTRFRDRIKVEFDIDVRCLDSELPLLTLQPLVENAIVHGIEPKEEGGHLNIRALGQGNQVRIEVEDDGLGMPPAVVEEVVRLESKRSGRSHLTGLGMGNVHKRLQYHFGAEYHRDVQSRLGEGTKITLIIPYRPVKAGKPNGQDIAGR